ncbi:MAG TPA: hypothetical protein VEJ63_02970 [Planctomycetota bacterium]|nr:hypothetical protein [Planctomycetota bacterium]
MSARICGLLLMWMFTTLVQGQAEAPKPDESVLHVYDLRPLLKPGAKQDVDFEMRDVHIRSIVSMLKEATGSEKDWGGPDVAFREINGMLYVKQRESVHSKLRQTLATLFKELEVVGVIAPKEEPKKEVAAGVDWTLQVYDLRLLLDSVPQVDTVYAMVPLDRYTDQKAEKPIAELINLIKESTGQSNWTAAEAVIRESKGRFYVTQREPVQRRIRQIVTELQKQKRTPLNIQVRIVNLSDSVAASQFSPQEFEELMARAGAGAEVARAQLHAADGQSTGTFSGREQSYLESFVANTEGGGNVAGVREANGSPLFEGLSVLIRPLVSPERDSIDLTLRTALVGNITYRKLTLSERLGMEMARVPEKAGEDRADLFAPPSRDVSRVLTQVHVPKGKWVLAGTVNSPADPKKLLHVFVSAQVLEH